ncbi:hypothetical protein D3870_18430 [Noviherbaspirillum cavernae]|uniref:Ketosynthase n=1 Tax=Noviherbaspirillum cavernae TaxID=2320862 RepID=A0A418X5E5_9BURK|nr:hypothetical protein [Noviherbaspirillum cavernae]RJG07707.1 hypothetical protein D3870_18430 [Noviherbaspirillum cavernae]
MPRLVRFGRWAAVIAMALGYAFLAHYTNTARTATLGTLVALSPFVLAGFSMAWHTRRRALMLALFGLACGALYMAWNTLTQHYSRIYWLEHAGTQLVLCLWFARTLAAGREPLCTVFARVVHGALPPEIERYTRQVTKAWAAFFGLMSASSTVIFLTAPLATWSAFSNFCTAPLIGLMFVAEYAVRRRLHPHMEHAHILDAVKAFWNVPAR